ncbi:hypothetical protein [Methanoculleus sp.]|uniref:hypothetical protein n=1 Tax=Methanoculleus sp. TaxID=90427 RepID=UPI0025DF2E23|nr:hypothetical protein [Methanoculleus sp.]MCK9317197.1 hypothetical protein [Methanoculleus sp.]MDD2253768.1 hypothetical protein [Methanoculleus sp.]MDD2787763.1 hypothetical protein [Methanoculleus sp.]MDD3216586.1 hypothetical protein [Methanoculleus sp.]MDD4314609.1 hypothetical protein [Methanoculleus sp.]
MIDSPANRLFCIAFLLMVVPVAVSGAPVTRTLSTAEPGAGEVFTVSLSIEDMALGGVVETLPGGYAFAGTGHPADRFLVRGQQVAFAVMNDTAVTYSARAPASGSGDITGTWEDYLAGSEGRIAASHVAVDGIETIAASAGAEPIASAAQQAASPCAVLAAVAGLILAGRWGGRR